MISQTEILKISEILKNDGVIAFPTDTVWGIGCLVEKNEAVKKIYKIKSREASKPLILLGNDIQSLLPYVENVPDYAKTFMEKHFPGALTLVLKKSLKTPDYITSGFNTVGIRVPDHPVLIEILEKSTETHVLATTSANISGEGAFANKQQVINSIGSGVDYVLDDYGYASKGQESTVAGIDDNNNVKIFRQGAVVLEL